MRPTAKRCFALVLALSLFATTGNFDSVQAAKIKLSKTKKTIKKDASFTLKVKGVKKVKWSTNRASVVKLSSKKKTSVKVKGIKAGKAKVTARYTANKKTKK